MEVRMGGKEEGLSMGVCDTMAHPNPPKGSGCQGKMNICLLRDPSFSPIKQGEGCPHPGGDLAILDLIQGPQGKTSAHMGLLTAVGTAPFGTRAGPCCPALE